MLHTFVGIAMEINQIYQIFKSNQFAFTTDSRNVKENDMFFALKGENFNGNGYALQALEQGASYAIIDEKEFATDDRCILVQDVLRCFQNLATYHRMEFPIPFIAVGGSNGKTTSKELIRQILSEKYKVHYTKGNFNNLIGVPITLLEMPTDADIAIIEIGTNTFGEIQQLCQIVKPTHGVITNIGKEHLEGFGDLEGVAKEESELYYYLHVNHGMAFVNADDEWLMRMANRIEHKKTYGKNADVEMELLQSMPNVKLKYGGEILESSLFGDHNYQNISLAVAIGDHFGLSVSQIKNGLAKYISSNNRSQIVEADTNTLILDAYNANPSSVESVLSSFSQSEATQKVAILGDMYELGDQRFQEHKAILDYVQRLNLDRTILVGDFYGEHKSLYPFEFYPSVDEVNKSLKLKPISNSHVLVKGSRGVKLEALDIIPK
jgi:UDP-N-acetylmuramoyl-tripeptide--D-alanyl-D-alanine ligase